MTESKRDWDRKTSNSVENSVAKELRILMYLKTGGWVVCSGLFSVFRLIKHRKFSFVLLSDNSLPYQPQVLITNSRICFSDSGSFRGFFWSFFDIKNKCFHVVCYYSCGYLECLTGVSYVNSRLNNYRLHIFFCLRYATAR